LVVLNVRVAVTELQTGLHDAVIHAHQEALVLDNENDTAFSKKQWKPIDGHNRPGITL
jgi:hypothetical protein